MKYQVKLNPEVVIFFTSELSFSFELVSKEKTINCSLELSAIRNATMDKYSFWIPNKLNSHNKKLSNYLKVELKKQVKELRDNNQLIPFDYHKSDRIFNPDGSYNCNPIKRKSYGSEMKFFNKNLYNKFIDAFLIDINLKTVDLHSC